MSVKKESELLEAPKAAKDIVQVHNIAAQSSNKNNINSNANHAAAAAAAKAALDAARKSLQIGANRRSIESIGDNSDNNSDKNPPDPIVTISKVSGLAGMAGNMINTCLHNSYSIKILLNTRQWLLLRV